MSSKINLNHTLVAVQLGHYVSQHGIDLQKLVFEEFGKNFIKSQNMSPDGFIQIALQLAYYEIYSTLRFMLVQYCGNLDFTNAEYANENITEHIFLI